MGLAAGVALAAALPELPYACGLATGALLSDDIVMRPLSVVDGMLPVTRPDEDLAALEPVAAAPERVRWWEDRVRRVSELLD